MVPRKSSLEKNENVSNAVLHNAWCREWKFKIQKIDRYKKYHEADLLQSVEENPWGHLDVDQILRPSCAAIPKTRREDVWKLPPTFA